MHRKDGSWEGAESSRAAKGLPRLMNAGFEPEPRAREGRRKESSGGACPLVSNWLPEEPAECLWKLPLGRARLHLRRQVWSGRLGRKTED